MRRDREQLNSSQKTVRLWTTRLTRAEQAELEETFETMYPHMLIEDTSLGVMPIGGRSSRVDFVVSWEPSDAKVERIIREGVADDYSRDLADAVSDFIRQAAQRVLVFGEASYEIVYYSRRPEDKPIAFELDYVYAGSLRHKGSKFVQLVPEEEAIKRALPRKIEVDEDEVLVFTFPPDISSLKRPLLIMKDLSKHPGPDFLMQSAPGTFPDVPYDFKRHHRETNILIAQLTREVGWSGRGLLADDMLEFYSLYRFLRFERFKICLREHLLEALNTGLQRIGRRLGFAGRIAVRGLPSRKDVDEALAQLASGPPSFKEVIEPFLRT